jgi:RHS repeat-associated protein
MTNSTGAIQQQLAYDPYGRVTQVQGSVFADLQYADYYYHEVSGLNLTRSRAYSSNLGRFINRDPIEEIGGHNLYAYVANEPTENIDPSGLESYEPCTTLLCCAQNYAKCAQYRDRKCCRKGYDWCVSFFKQDLFFGTPASHDSSALFATCKPLCKPQPQLKNPGDQQGVV